MECLPGPTKFGEENSMDWILVIRAPWRRQTDPRGCSRCQQGSPGSSSSEPEMSSKEILLGNALQKDEQSVQVGFPSVICGFAGEKTNTDAISDKPCKGLSVLGFSGKRFLGSLQKVQCSGSVNCRHGTNAGTTGLRKCCRPSYNNILCLLDCNFYAYFTVITIRNRYYAEVYRNVVKKYLL